MPEFFFFFFFVIVFYNRNRNLGSDMKRTGNQYRAHNQSFCQRSLVTETVMHISAVDSEFCNRREC